MTVANVKDDQFEETQESGQESGRLILGSEADVAATLQIVSVLSIEDDRATIFIAGCL